VHPHATCPPPLCRSGQPSKEEKAFWAKQPQRRAQARAATDDLALGKLDELARREDKVGGWALGCALLGSSFAWLAGCPVAQDPKPLSLPLLLVLAQGGAGGAGKAPGGKVGAAGGGDGEGGEEGAPEELEVEEDDDAPEDDDYYQVTPQLLSYAIVVVSYFLNSLCMRPGA
jgi:hypothetical protein